jgi:hypothetical protein
MHCPHAGQIDYDAVIAKGAAAHICVRRRESRSTGCWPARS